MFFVKINVGFRKNINPWSRLPVSFSGPPSPEITSVSLMRSEHRKRIPAPSVPDPLKRGPAPSDPDPLRRGSAPSNPERRKRGPSPSEFKRGSAPSNPERRKRGPSPSESRRSSVSSHSERSKRAPAPPESGPLRGGPVPSESEPLKRGPGVWNTVYKTGLFGFHQPVLVQMDKDWPMAKPHSLNLACTAQFTNYACNDDFMTLENCGDGKERHQLKKYIDLWTLWGVNLFPIKMDKI